MQQECILIDPPYKAYYGDAFFDKSNHSLNRDGSLEANARLRLKLVQEGKDVHTADFLLGSEKKERENKVYKYYSFGLLDNYRKFAEQSNVSLEAFFIMEPPVVLPQLYRALPALTKYFKRVYLHNTNGDGYSLIGVDTSKLHKLYYPLPYADVIDTIWKESDRQHRIVVINSNHNPILFAVRGLSFSALKKELYSERINAMAKLAEFGVIDLYGRRWKEWWSPFSMWFPYWSNRRTLMKIYKGSCGSKYEILSKYKFCLCFENMLMDGYVTEKIFDCLYAGTIPLYLGAQDIEDQVPNGFYIDCRAYESWEELWAMVSALTEPEINEMKLAGRLFIKSSIAKKYINFLDNVIS